MRSKTIMAFVLALALPLVWSPLAFSGAMDASKSAGDAMQAEHSKKGEDARSLERGDMPAKSVGNDDRDKAKERGEQEGESAAAKAKGKK